MKVPVALLTLVSVAAAGASKKTPPSGVAGWDYCAASVWCNSDEDCQRSSICEHMALYHDKDYIACGVDIFQPHTCWTWTQGQPH